MIVTQHHISLGSGDPEPVPGAKAESARDPAPPSHHTSLGQGDTPGVLSRAQGGAGAIRLRTSPHKPGTGRHPRRPVTGPKRSRSDPTPPSNHTSLGRGVTPAVQSQAQERSRSD